MYEETTIIIICREIDAYTRRCADRCLATCPGAGILIVCDNPSGSPFADPRVRILKSVSPSLGAKRNQAVKSAATPYVALIDDDAYPHRDWLGNALRILKADSDVGAVGGPCVPPPDQPLTRRVTGNACRSFLVSGLYFYGHSRLPRTRDREHLSSCNMVLRTADYLRVEGMDEDGFMCDDVSLCARLRREGLRLRFASDVVVYHTSRTLRGFVWQRFSRGTQTLPDWRRSGSACLASELISPAFLMFLLIGPALLRVPALRWFYPAVTLAYLLACATETVRFSRGLIEVPGTFVAILIGNLGPGLGFLVSCLGVRIPPERIYRSRCQLTAAEMSVGEV
jgi:cellulose synthase/poly-beta-1,6-N-acetylglucosamine synthase-like glycosyltransferase